MSEKKQVKDGRRECADLIVHPRVSAKLDEIDGLRKKLGALIEEQESLLYRQRDLLMAQYNRDIGYLEHELFLLDVELAELRRRIAILQADINRGRAVTAERLVHLDEEIRAEFEKFRVEIKARERELRDSAGLLETAEWMEPEQARELKLLYRRICQRYHPDVGGDNAERGKEIWSTLQHAYRTGDLELLNALAETLDLSGKDTPKVPDDLDSEIKRLNSLITKQSERLAGLLSELPFSCRDQLEDAQWVQATQEKLRQEIAAREQHRVKLQGRYEMLLPASGATH